MSLFSIQQYYSELEKIIHFGGTKNETAIRNAFYNLLNEYAKQKGLMIVTEVAIKATNSNKSVFPDGTLKDVLRQDWGYWESKDESDDLDEEIRKKFEKGYPKENILFEDSQNVVLFQSGQEVMRISMKDPEALDRLLNLFVNYERPEVRNFRKAIELFKQDIPKVTETIRGIILAAEKTNQEFKKAGNEFLKLCHDSIKPDITFEDVREMIIQHILTEDIFNTIFDETQFHRENNIARELEKVIHTFFTGNTRRIALSTIQHYYQAINAAAAGIADHHEKQKFLKVVYETFYKSYNPKAADRLGVVYTPNEIVQFMIKGTDYLLHKHFNKFLEDKNVEILDPATGTGTFICDIIDYISKDKLEYKYLNEIHANEVAILPYYISNLNIEFTYTQKMGKYAEFENLCFVDTLDNMGFIWEGKQGDLFAPITEENTKRIRKQNSRKIAVIIGNPPYNANQANENDNNKNREYSVIDKRIKDTFIKYSSAQKTKLYDPYARFYRWAMDRLDHKGIITFITNNSFIHTKTFDGFRKCIQDEFQFAYIIDLGGNIRELSGRDGIFLNEKHTIFGQAAAVGIAIMFLIKDINVKIKNSKCTINYIHPMDIRATRDDKIAYLAEHDFTKISFEHIQPDDKNNWLFEKNDFGTLLNLYNKDGKKSIFQSSSLGVSTNRDEWVYDKSENNLLKKMQYFADCYNVLLAEKNLVFPNVIKWSRDLKKKFSQAKKLNFDKLHIRNSFHRPFVREFWYSEKLLNDVLTKNHVEYYGESLSLKNPTIGVVIEAQIPFVALSVDCVSNMHIGGRQTQMFPLYKYDAKGSRENNISDWALNQFIRQYGKKGINKETIFYYIYSILHNPIYRKKYELNLKREFPRIPFYEDFYKWSNWGKELMDLHINYETVYPYQLVEVSTSDRETPKCKLKADKENGIIYLDENTYLSGIPKIAWDYKLGNRSALEWVLDQYKESKPKDPTIAEKFNTYRFEDYKVKVIDLLKRVCTVSVKTMEIVNQMSLENI